MTSIAQIFKAIRKEINYTQKEFSDALEVSRSAIAQVESGNNNPSHKLVHKILSTFKLSDKLKIELDKFFAFNEGLNEGVNTGLTNKQASETNKKDVLQEGDWIDYRTPKGLIVTGIVGNLEMIEQTKTILQKMAGHFNYNYNEIVVCSRYLSMAKRLNLSELTTEFESKNSKELSKAFLEKLLEASSECYQAIQDDLQSYSFFLFILNDGNINNA